MKKTFTTLILLSAAFTVSAQALHTSSPGVEIRQIEGRPERMSVRVAGYELLVERDTSPSGSHHHHHHHSRMNPDYYGGRIGSVEIGFGGFRATPSAYASYPASEQGFMDLDMGSSIHLAFNLFTFSSALTHDKTLGVTAAAGLSISNFTFETPVGMAKVDGVIRPLDVASLKKAKLTTFAVHFPLALEVNPTRDFFFSVGGYADLMISSHFKWKSPKQKLHSPYTNFLQAGFEARVGFRHAYAFASYGMVEMFRRNHGPVLNPYTFGIGFGF